MHAGTQVTFLAYGVTCIIVFVGYFALIFLHVSKQSLPPPIEDSTAGQTESVYLAPHGVPGGIPRSPSKAKGTTVVKTCLLNYEFFAMILSHFLPTTSMRQVMPSPQSVRLSVCYHYLQNRLAVDLAWDDHACDCLLYTSDAADE